MSVTLEDAYRSMSAATRLNGGNWQWVFSEETYKQLAELTDNDPVEDWGWPIEEILFCNHRVRIDNTVEGVDWESLP